jgi:hypothetical protein
MSTVVLDAADSAQESTVVSLPPPSACSLSRLITNTTASLDTRCKHRSPSALGPGYNCLRYVRLFTNASISHCCSFQTGPAASARSQTINSVACLGLAARLLHLILLPPPQRSQLLSPRTTPPTVTPSPTRPRQVQPPVLPTPQLDQ